MSIKYSICITYFFKRNNIFNLIKEIDLKKNKHVEIIVRNDNASHTLNLPRHPRLKVFNNKKKALGEINSIKFLLSKATAAYVAVIADDDLISFKIFNSIEKDYPKKNCYLFIATKNKKFFLSRNKFIYKSSEEYLLNFFKYKIFLSGTVGTVFKKEFLIKKLKNIKIKKYLLDTYLLFTIIQNSHKIYDIIYGFNNAKSSRISSAKIDIPIFISDYVYLLSKIKKSKLKLKFVLFIINEFYSLLYRGEKQKIKMFFKFIKNNLETSNLNYTIKFLLIPYFFLYSIKILLKAIKIF